MSNSHTERDHEQLNSDEQYRQALRNFASAENVEGESQTAEGDQVQNTLE